MKFVKGMIVGTAIAAGVALMYNDGMMNKKRIMKRGKHKIGTYGAKEKLHARIQHPAQMHRLRKLFQKASAK